MPRAFYDPSSVSTETVYRVAKAGDPFFIPAYPILDEEQKAGINHSLNGTRTNAEDGTNSVAPRNLTDSVFRNPTAQAAYNSAAVVQNQKLNPNGSSSAS